jgi:hypothetical protein
VWNAMLKEKFIGEAISYPAKRDYNFKSMVA